jgi:molecular chaperone GrpE
MDGIGKAQKLERRRRMEQMPKRAMLTKDLANQVVSEHPISLRVSNGEHAKEVGNGLAAIEQDIRALMCKAAELRQEKDQIEEQGRKEMAKILLAILEALDAFGRVYRNVQAQQDQVTPQKIKNWLGNFRTVRRLLDKILEEQGVVPLENIDRQFNPHWHQAVEVVVDSELPPGAILEEERPGYLWHGKLLRKAEVKVATAEMTSIGIEVKDVMN